jgi:hypothetical protein
VPPNFITTTLESGADSAGACVASYSVVVTPPDSRDAPDRLPA